MQASPTSVVACYRSGVQLGHCILCGKVKREESAEEATDAHHVTRDDSICRYVGVTVCPYIGGTK